MKKLLLYVATITILFYAACQSSPVKEEVKIDATVADTASVDSVTPLKIVKTDSVKK